MFATRIWRLHATSPTLGTNSLEHLKRGRSTVLSFGGENKHQVAGEQCESTQQSQPRQQQQQQQQQQQPVDATI